MNVNINFNLIQTDLYHTIVNDDINPKITISTMTFCGNINKQLRVELILKNSELAFTNKEIIRKTSTRGRKPKLKTDNTFLNSVTIYVTTSEKSKPANVKLFKNGSIQITGCISISHVILILDKVIKEIIKLYEIDQNIFIDQNNEDLTINNFRAVMINCSTKCCFQIDREALYTCCKNNKICVNFDSNEYSGVRIKFLNETENKISVSVFETGNILIQGAQNYKDVKFAYDKIIFILLSNYNQIACNIGAFVDKYIKFSVYLK